VVQSLSLVYRIHFIGWGSRRLQSSAASWAQQALLSHVISLHLIWCMRRKLGDGGRCVVFSVPIWNTAEVFLHWWTMVERLKWYSTWIAPPVPLRQRETSFLSPYLLTVFLNDPFPPLSSIGLHVTTAFPSSLFLCLWDCPINPPPTAA
jgi:hypothetical protein